MRRRLRWIIPIVLILLTLAWLDMRYIDPRQVGEDKIQGMSKQQLRARYGEPSWIDTEDSWVYYKGMFGGGTGITFKNGIVVQCGVRAAR
jgi:hypothetical protein